MHGRRPLPRIGDALAACDPFRLATADAPSSRSAIRTDPDAERRPRPHPTGPCPSSSVQQLGASEKRFRSPGRVRTTRADTQSRTPSRHLETSRAPLFGRVPWHPLGSSPAKSMVHRAANPRCSLQRHARDRVSGDHPGSPNTSRPWTPDRRTPGERKPGTQAAFAVASPPGGSMHDASQRASASLILTSPFSQFG